MDSAMRPWNKAALDLMREELGQLQMEDANMIKKLEKSVDCGPNSCLGFLSRTQVQVVQSKTTPFQQMNKVIEYLKEMENKHFENFCNILEDCNFKLQADKLREYAEDTKRKFEAQQEAKIAAIPPVRDDDSNAPPNTPFPLSYCAEDMLAVQRRGSLDTAVVVPPSHHHHDSLHGLVKGTIISDNIVIKLRKKPRIAIEKLYVNAYLVLLQILGSFFDRIKELALDAVRMRQVSGTEKKVKQAHDLRALFRCIKIDKKWNDVQFLSLAISLCTPQNSKEQEAGRMVLNRYSSYFEAYKEATSIKKGGKSMFGRRQHREETLTVMKVTVNKDPEDYTCRDLIELWKQFLIKALQIPADHIQYSDAFRTESTTLVFMLPRTAAIETEDKLSRPAVIWVMKELGILRVHVAGVYRHEALPTVPAASIRDGLQSGVDFIALTKSWSPLRCVSVEQTPQPMKSQLKPMPLPWEASLPQLFAAFPEVSIEDRAELAEGTRLSSEFLQFPIMVDCFVDSEDLQLSSEESDEDWTEAFVFRQQHDKSSEFLQFPIMVDCLADSEDLQLLPPVEPVPADKKEFEDTKSSSESLHFPIMVDCSADSEDLQLWSQEESEDTRLGNLERSQKTQNRSPRMHRHGHPKPEVTEYN